jgi:tetratricopeptide (TPR) repeat protein
MRKYWICLWIVLLFLSSCKDERTLLKEKIERLESSFFEESNQQVIPHLMKSYTTYRKNYPEDSVNVEYLFHAAEIYRMEGDPLRAVSCYHQVFTQYPQSEKQPVALFMEGFLYENELNDLLKAREKYQLFIANFPDHPLYKDVNFSLANLGKNAETLLQEILAKKTADSIESMP